MRDAAVEPGGQLDAGQGWDAVAAECHLEADQAIDRVVVGQGRETDTRSGQRCGQRLGRLFAITAVERVGVEVDVHDPARMLEPVPTDPVGPKAPFGTGIGSVTTSR